MELIRDGSAREEEGLADGKDVSFYQSTGRDNQVLPEPLTE